MFSKDVKWINTLRYKENVIYEEIIKGKFIGIQEFWIPILISFEVSQPEKLYYESVFIETKKTLQNIFGIEESKKSMNNFLNSLDTNAMIMIKGGGEEDEDLWGPPAGDGN